MPEVDCALTRCRSCTDEFDATASRLATAEEQVEDLKLQLDAAMGAEDMLEQLTDRNLTLNEKMEDMKMVIEDLEALKELADELEENHVETEKQMQEEIGPSHRFTLRLQF